MAGQLHAAPQADAPDSDVSSSLLGALQWGVLRAWRCRGLVGLLWLVNLGLLVAVLPGQVRVGGMPEASAALLDEHSLGLVPLHWADLATVGLGPWALANVATLSVAVFCVLLQLVLAAGILAQLQTPQQPFLPGFGAAGAAHAGRFWRLSLFSIVFYWMTLLFDRLLHKLFEGGVGTVLDRPHSIHRWIGVVLLFCITMTFDYAKVRTVVTGSRSMILESLRSAAFVRRYFVRTAGLYGVLVGLGALLALFAVRGGAWRLSLDGSIDQIVVQQAILLAMCWLRVVAWGAELSLYLSIAREELARRPT